MQANGAGAGADAGADADARDVHSNPQRRYTLETIRHWWQSADR